METNNLNVFLDTDVIISSFLSDKGAAYSILNQPNIKINITELSIKEVKKVADRLNINKNKVEECLLNKFCITNLDVPYNNLVKKYAGSIFDKYDSHILAGAIVSNSNYLITYNLKHFNIDLISKNYKIMVMTPGSFLQYLRLLNTK